MSSALIPWVPLVPLFIVGFGGFVLMLLDAFTEEDAQLATLSRLGCDLAQGFLCGRPAAATDVRTA